MENVAASPSIVQPKKLTIQCLLQLLTIEDINLLKKELACNLDEYWVYQNMLGQVSQTQGPTIVKCSREVELFNILLNDSKMDIRFTSWPKFPLHLLIQFFRQTDQILTDEMLKSKYFMMYFNVMDGYYERRDVYLKLDDGEKLEYIRWHIENLKEKKILMTLADFLATL